MSVVSKPAIAGLEIRPPAEIAVGQGSAFVIGGYCYHPAERTRELAVQVGDSRQPVERFRLPRDDVYEGLEAGDPARAHAYRSGFVALVDLHPIDRPQRLEVELVVGLAGGGEARVPAGSVDVRPDLPPPADAPAPEFPDLPGPRVAICMATYEPPEDLLQIQLESIRAADPRELDLPDQR